MTARSPDICIEPRDESPLSCVALRNALSAERPRISCEATGARRRTRALAARRGRFVSFIRLFDSTLVGNHGSVCDHIPLNLSTSHSESIAKAPLSCPNQYT